MIGHVMTAFTGLAAGFAVGGGFVAFISVLGVLPRIIIMASQKTRLRAMEWSMITGALLGTAVMYIPFSVQLSLIIPVSGLLSGMFVGMMAAALTEVLNVIPLITRRLKITGSIEYIITAIIAGKVAGSLFYWLIFLPVWKG
ncbi:stage V sporulation protein AB [Jeotgalibacillus haloalkalitolerans]|uniref:Stage V sporulation protein AB n=1 Tax=Jeotgalibacillus haloalkalitolerans TaxID=3104292 RepID=A0ABU5KLB5_9BACL|nr:stage V sporulation protein AB [Jeotgalibacillus sp. HH7-29]MDZ5712059.1 stage V sporulation protein AB [Jeotgalibacillus sp. HH7-29]